MKKTMFLAALMGAALCGTAMGATTYSWNSTTNTTTVTTDGADPVVYSGSVFTWTGAGSTASGANNWTYVTDADGSTATSVAWAGKTTDANYNNPGNGFRALANYGQVGDATSPNFNTIHYTGSTNNKGGLYDFTPLTIAGVIVDEGATGYSLSANHNRSDRQIYLGNANATAALSSIQEDFTLSSSSGTNVGAGITVRGTQTWDIATDKTFTLNSGTGAKTISGDLSIIGGGTASFAGTGATTIATGSTINVASGSTLALAGTVNVIATADDMVSGTETQKLEGNGFGTAQYSRVVYTGEGALSGDVTWQINGAADGVSYDAATHTISGIGNTQTFYINDATADWNEGAAKVVDVNVGSNTLSLAAGKSLNVETLHIESGRVETLRSNATGVVTGDIIVDGGATLAVTGAGQDAFGYSGTWGGNYTDAISLNGTDADHKATLELSQTTANSVTMSTNLNLNGFAQITTPDEAKRGFNTFGGEITATNTDNEIAASVVLRQAVNVDVAEGGELLISGALTASPENNAACSLTKSGDGTLTISGDITGTAAHKVTINGDGANTIITSSSISNATLNNVTFGEGSHVMSNVSFTSATAANLTMESVTLNAGNTIELGTDHAGQLTTSAMTVNGNATVNADLVFAENSVLTFNGGSVTLGCTIDFGTGTTIALGEAYHEDLANNGMTLLFSGVDADDGLINGLENVVVTGNFVPGHLVAVQQSDGTYNIYATPEPATATLSLLALAGLMARRRRH